MSLVPGFLKDLHLKYIQSLNEKKDRLEYYFTEHLRLNGVYWAYTTLELLMVTPEEKAAKNTIMDREQMIDYVVQCQDEETGGFGGHIGHDPHLLYTLSAVQILITAKALDRLPNKDKLVKYVAGLQNDDGSFSGDIWGEVDVRFSYCAVACLTLLNEIDKINIEKAIDFLCQCKNFDGGYGSVPGAESHSGLVFCCVGALSILNALDRVDADRLAWWLAERQLPNGGLNGRPDKFEDVCYSWWVLASLSILGRSHWIQSEKLAQFILTAQDTEQGGIADRPGDVADIFHTLFGVAGLSMLEYVPLRQVDPRFCMPKHIIDSLNI